MVEAKHRIFSVRDNLYYLEEPEETNWMREAAELKPN
jgi:hypothetical protein